MNQLLLLFCSCKKQIRTFTVLYLYTSTANVWLLKRRPMNYHPWCSILNEFASRFCDPANESQGRRCSETFGDTRG